MSNKQTTKLLCLLGAATMFTLTAAVQADSQRVQWSSNKHFYQRFDQKVTWGTAQSNCQTRGAHLVTITSDIERSFVSEITPGTEFWLGGSDAGVEGRFTWATGEKWSYEQPINYNQESSDYLHSYSVSFGTGWYASSATYTTTYVCEWSTDTLVGVTNVPDFNGNKIPEIAVLYIDYKTGRHTVKIRDPKTGKVISTLLFKSGFAVPPAGPAVIKDTNGNKVPDIAVLYTEFGQPSVGIKDAKNDQVLLNTLRFLDSNYDPKEISVSPDLNGNGYNEITVLGTRKSNNAIKAETRDSKTGELLNNVAF